MKTTTPGQIRVWQLARALGVPSLSVIREMQALSLAVRSASSAIEPTLAQALACRLLGTDVSLPALSQPEADRLTDARAHVEHLTVNAPCPACPARLPRPYDHQVDGL